MVHSRQFMQHKAGCLSTETPKSLKTALIKWHVDFCCYSCYTGVLQTIEKQTSDYKEQNCNIYFKKKRRSKSNFRQTELSNDRFLSIENRVKQLRLRHTYNIYSNKCSAYLKTKHFRKVQNPTDITIGGEVFSIQHYGRKFVSDLRQIDDFLQELGSGFLHQ